MTVPGPVPAVPSAPDREAECERVGAIIERLAELGVPAAALAPARDWLRDRRAGKPEHAWYFGCWGQSGHHLWLPDGRHPDRDDPVAGWNKAGPFDRIDGQLTPTGTTKQSAAALHHRDGWAALAMHDYSEDTRGGSNAAFIFDADLSWDRALAEAREWFPKVVARIEAAAPITGPHESDSRRRR